MDRMRVESESVASIGYEPSKLVLEVEFTNGSIYRYLDVPEDEYTNLMAAKSLGRYLNQHIKGNYEYVPL